jgi:hypothetical protein
MIELPAVTVPGLIATAVVRARLLAASRPFRALRCIEWVTQRQAM